MKGLAKTCQLTFVQEGSAYLPGCRAVLCGGALAAENNTNGCLCAAEPLLSRGSHEDHLLRVTCLPSRAVSHQDVDESFHQGGPAPTLGMGSWRPTLRRFRPVGLFLFFFFVSLAPLIKGGLSGVSSQISHVTRTSPEKHPFLFKVNLCLKVTGKPAESLQTKKMSSQKAAADFTRVSVPRLKVPSCFHSRFQVCQTETPTDHDAPPVSDTFY